MNSNQDPIPNKTFLDLYTNVKEYSKHYNLNFQQAILQAITLASRGDNNYQVLSKLSSPASSTSCRQSDLPTSGSVVWLVVGQTGQGKSSLINAICCQQVAQEGRGGHSLTSEVKLYPVKGSDLCLIDTPGFQDTRLGMKDEKIADEIVKLVQKKLEANANIGAILLMWNPARFMRLTLDAMLDKLCTYFGSKALDSLVFVINEVTKKWDQECEDAVDELLDDLESRELDIPVVRLDAKMFTQKDFDALNEACQDVEPYKEADFEKYRKTYYYQKYVELVTTEDNKRREQKIIEDRVREEEQRKAQERERIRRQKEEEDRRQAEERERRNKQQYEEEQRKAQERERMLRQKNEEDQRRAKEEETRLKQENEKLRSERLQQQNTSYRGSTSSLSQFLDMFQGQESMPYYRNSFACSSPFNYSNFSKPNNYSIYSNINDSVSGRTTRSGAHDYRDTSYRVVPHLTKGGAPDMRFSCNKKK